MLEKKWTAVIRLQKKVLELESKLGALMDPLGDQLSPERIRNFYQKDHHVLL
jgi:hypothetical protein